MDKVKIIGAGLAGSECAYQLAQRHIYVELYEMRPKEMTGAHKSSNFAELVCSNSFRSSDINFNAVGELHYELRKLNSLIMKSADKNSIPSGKSLGIDREEFSNFITKEIENNKYIKIIREPVEDISNDEITVIATGPLTSAKLQENIINLSGIDNFSFYDAIAPIIYFETIDMDKAWFQSRYDDNTNKDSKGDYINCPLTEDEYNIFIDDLLASEKTEFKEFEKLNYFDACLPIEEMAKRGRKTLLFGPMKSIGLFNPHKNERPYAVIQLRMDNRLGTIYNMVGFQTKLKYDAQLKIFRKIPGLEKAVFARMGGIHKNNFINSPLILHENLSMKKYENIFFAGQITGVEGYVESTSMGLLAAISIYKKINNEKFTPPPINTSIGSMLNYITKGHNIESNSFQPMNVNFGLFPNPIEIHKDLPEEFYEKKGLKKSQIKKFQKKFSYTKEAKQSLGKWIDGNKINQ